MNANEIMSRLDSIRREKHLSHKRLAERSGVSAGTIATYLSSSAREPPSTLRNVAALLGAMGYRLVIKSNDPLNLLGSDEPSLSHASEEQLLLELAKRLDASDNPAGRKLCQRIREILLGVRA